MKYFSVEFGGWYTIEVINDPLEGNEYRAEVMGQAARGRTPEEAIANAARLSEPQPATVLCRFYYNCTSPINCDDCENREE